MGGQKDSRARSGHDVVLLSVVILGSGAEGDGSGRGGLRGGDGVGVEGGVEGGRGGKVAQRGYVVGVGALDEGLDVLVEGAHGLGDGVVVGLGGGVAVGVGAGYSVRYFQETAEPFVGVGVNEASQFTDEGDNLVGGDVPVAGVVADGGLVALVGGVASDVGAVVCSGPRRSDGLDVDDDSAARSVCTMSCKALYSFAQLIGRRAVLRGPEVPEGDPEGLRRMA
jgi:hypothetical protein